MIESPKTTAQKPRSVPKRSAVISQTTPNHAQNKQPPLDALCVLYPGNLRYELGERMTAIPAAEFFAAEAVTASNAQAR